MKKLSCSAMGGGDQCDAVFEAETSEEMVEIGTKHVMESPIHEDLRKKMAANSDEDKAVWYKEYNKLWEETPEV
jgi:hypothetical protein